MSAWIPLLINSCIALLGVLQSADWVHLVGSSEAGTVAAFIAGLNALAHAYASAGPASRKSA